MNQSPLLYPVFAQVGLTFMVWCGLYVTRLKSMVVNKVRIEDLRTDEGFDRIKDARNPSENFENLFEVPVLFFALMGFLMLLGITDLIFTRGAWIFVGFRIIHSLIHCTVNVIKFRFIAYFISTGALWWMWFEFARIFLKN